MAVKKITLPNTTVTTAGTRVQVSTDKIMVNALIIQAHENNTGDIYVGDENVSASRGIAIGKGQPYQYAAHPQMQMLSEFLLSDVWIDAEKSGDKVRAVYFKRKKYDAFS